MALRLVRLSLVATILVLAPAAYASPPDETWIAGIYDNADFDDVVLFVTSGLGAVQPSPSWLLCIVLVVVDFVSPGDTRGRSGRCIAVSPERAPPLA